MKFIILGIVLLFASCGKEGLSVPTQLGTVNGYTVQRLFYSDGAGNDDTIYIVADNTNDSNYTIF